MRPHKRVLAAVTAGLLAFGLSACEANPEAADEMQEEPGLEDGGGGDDL